MRPNHSCYYQGASGLHFPVVYLRFCHEARLVRSTQLVYPEEKDPCPQHPKSHSVAIPSTTFICLAQNQDPSLISCVHSLTLTCIHRVTPADYYHVQIPSTGKCPVAAIQPKYEFEKSTISSASSAAVLMAESTRPKPRIENSLARIRTAHTRNASFLLSRSEALVKPICKC